ncbi:MAG: DUF928 domain-containing protein [Saprospiraceae bacterium]|nr:DUF928 domain-containing protein [Saprospiraceae bacterium]
MKNQLLIWACALLGMVSAQAQEVAPVALVAASGKVVYSSGGAKQKLVPGAVMKSSGTLTLGKNGSALLLSDGRFKQLSGKQSWVLASQFQADADGVSRLNFDQTFSNYVMSALQLAASPENAGDAWGAVRTGTGTGDGWGSVRTGTGTGDGWGNVRTGTGTGDGWGVVRTGTGTGDGWGGKGNSIRAIRPFGKVLPGTATFRWSKPAGNRSFKLIISDMRNQTVLETTTVDTFFTVDLTQPPFQAGGTYQWSIASNESPAAVSNTLQIELSDAAGRKAAIERVQRAASHAQNPPEVQMLMQAVSLEQADFFEEAAGIYSTLQKSQPKNQLARLMHAAFWMRYGLKEVATEVYVRGGKESK